MDQRFVSVLSFLLIAIFAPAPTFQNQYCAITPQHTLCKFQGVGTKCKTPFEIGIPPEDRELIMSLHNSYRSRVASGQEVRGRPGPQPAASNMRELVWDDELALTAQRLADQCKYTHDCLECRKVSRFLTGQNLYQFSENVRRPKSNWASAINAWYDEVAQWSPGHIQSFHFIKPLGHYTQMVWAETERMGCGYSYFNEGKWNRKLYICNYGSAGNIITTPMYLQGQPCSACPQGSTCSTKYPGLCTVSSPQHSSALSFPKPSHFAEFQAPRPTTTTTPRPNTKQPVILNEIESNDIQFEFRTNFPRKSKKPSRFFYETQPTIVQRPSFEPTRFSFVPTSTSPPALIPVLSAFPTRSTINQETIIFPDRTDPQQAHPTATSTVHHNAEPPIQRISDTNSILLYCDFDYAKCPIRFTGETWNYTEPGTIGISRSFATQVTSGQMSNLFIRSLMSGQQDGQVCLSFRYLKPILLGAAPLRVTAGTLNQKPRVVEILEQSTSLTDWLTANIQFENLRSNFLVIFQVPRNHLPDPVQLAIDDVLVTKGRCP